MLAECRLSAFLAMVSVVFSLTQVSADEWPQWRGPNRDGVWAESGVIEKFTSPEIERRWSVPISGGYSGPTVADGRVFVTDRLFEPEEIERVHCFEWQSGSKIWSFRYDCEYTGFGYKAGPRASVLIDEGRAYSLGAAGHLFCFDAAEGTVLWSRDLRSEYKIRMPNWGIAASPVVEGGLLILQIGGDGEACLIALDKITGQQRWTALSDDASYAAPIVIDQCGKRVLVCKTGDRVVGVDPATGKLRWEYPVPCSMGQVAHRDRDSRAGTRHAADLRGAQGHVAVASFHGKSDGGEDLAPVSREFRGRSGPSLSELDTVCRWQLHLRRRWPGRPAVLATRHRRAGLGG